MTREELMNAFRVQVSEQEEDAMIPILMLVTEDNRRAYVGLPIPPSMSAATALGICYNVVLPGILAGSKVREVTFASEVWVRHFSPIEETETGLDEALALAHVEAEGETWYGVQRFVRMDGKVTWREEPEFIADESLDGDVMPVLKAMVAL